MALGSAVAQVGTERVLDDERVLFRIENAVEPAVVARMAFLLVFRTRRWQIIVVIIVNVDVDVDLDVDVSL
jgi:hypothetical protein